MSNYTTQVRWLVEMNSTEGIPISQRITESLPKIFNFQYPIWSENYRRILERKIIMHYFNKEICSETVGLWKIYLEERLNLIMPYYNEMYKTVSINYEWLEDVNETETYGGVKNSSGLTTGKSNQNDNVVSKSIEDSTGTNNGINKNLKSDTPQANYGGLDYATELEENTDTNSTTNNVTNNSNSSNNSTSDMTSTSSNNLKDDYTRVRKGLNGSHTKTQLNDEYRKSLINIDKKIIEELYDLFMLIY